jgi:RNA polymerase sigma-70 factor, ECF subfamily
MAQGISMVDASSSEAGLEAAFVDYYPRVVQVLDRMLGNRFEAEEVAVETFLKLAGQGTPLTEYGNLGGWLYRTATRLGIDFMRAAERRRRYEELAARESREQESPLDDVMREDRARTAREALARLSPSQAQLLMLRSQGLSYKELAEAMKIKPVSVGKLLERAQSAFEKAYRQAETRRQS